MTKYGPFPAGSLANESQGKTPWNIAAGVASASLGAEGTTDFLIAKGFGANVPSDKTITQVRFVLSPDLGGVFNISDQSLVGASGDAYAAATYVYSEDAGLTPAVVNHPEFGAKVSVHAPSGGSVAVSVAMEVETD